MYIKWKLNQWLTDGLFGKPTRWPHVFNRLTNLSRTLHWLIQGRFQPENVAESAAVKDKDLLGDRVLDVGPEPPWLEVSFLLLLPPTICCGVLFCVEWMLSLLSKLLDPIVDALEIDPSTLVIWPELIVSSTDPPDAAPMAYWPWDEVSVAVEAIEYDP